MTTRPFHTAVVAGAVLALVSAAPVAAQTGGYGHRPKSSIHKMDEALRQSLKQAPKPERVIIRMKAGYEGAMKSALQWHGDVVEKEHRALGAMTAIVHGEDLEAIANDPAVESVSADVPVRVQGAAVTRVVTREAVQKKVTNRQIAKRAVVDTRKQTRIKKTKVVAEILGTQRQLQGLSNGEATGKGVGVAVIDSGIQLSEDLSAQVTAFVDFTSGAPVFKTPYDDYGHGTFVASLIANSGKVEGKYQGVAPGAHLIGLKVLDKDGSGQTSDVIAAIEFAVAYKNLLDIDVINLSLGHPVFESAATDPLVQAVEHAVRNGIVVVTSAGNFGMNPTTRQVGYGGVASPGNAPSAITVGAVDTKHTIERTDDVVAPFSSRGPAWIDGLAKPDILAPGVGEDAKAAENASLYKLYPQVLEDDDATISIKRFAKLSGTSMAAGVASGVVALVLEANGKLTPNAVKAVLEYTATPISSQTGLYDALTQGAGEVNGGGAIAMAKTIDTTMPQGLPWLTAPLTPFTTFNKQDAAWAQNIIWGNYYIKGTALGFNTEAWDENIVWGNVGDGYEGDGGENVVWGTLADVDQADNVVWGNTYFDAWSGENIVWGNFEFERDGDNIVWGNFSRDAEDNVVWGNAFTWDDNVVWGNAEFGYADGDNVVWGNSANWDGDGDNVVWGNLDDDNVVWGNFYDEDGGENVVWGNAVLVGKVK